MHAREIYIVKINYHKNELAPPCKWL